MLGPLKDHVLYEMGYAIPWQVFVARSAFNPDADGNGTNVLHFLGEDGQPVGQHCSLDVFGFSNHRGSRADDRLGLTNYPIVTHCRIVCYSRHIIIIINYLQRIIQLVVATAVLAAASILFYNGTTSSRSYTWN